MKPQKVQNNDTVSRSIVEPTHLDGVGKVILDTFTFQEGRAESINNHRMLKNDNEAHQLGIRLVDGSNKRALAAGKPTNKIYRGYIKSLVSKIHGIKIQNVFFEISHTPQADNHAHCDIELKTTDGAKPSKNIKNTARTDLLEAFDPLTNYEPS